jgi:hypothetical protein
LLVVVVAYCLALLLLPQPQGPPRRPLLCCAPHCRAAWQAAGAAACLVL